MSTLYVVRHGQARLFTEDYDRLSELGVAQASALGRFWHEAGIRIDAAWSGTLRRQIDTASAVAEAFEAAGQPFPMTEQMAGFDEYPAEALVQVLGEYLREVDPAIAELARLSESSTDPGMRYRHFHRLLEAVIGRWVDSDYDSSLALPVSWKSWSAGVRGALKRVMSEAGRGSSAAIFTSGGVVGVSVQTVLQAPDIKAAELNWRVHNASVTRYTFSGGARVSLDRFNDVSHLAPAQLTFR